MGVAVELAGVGKRYPNGVAALVDFTLSVVPGTLLTVLGPSGSGKSTLLRLLAGLDSPDSGTIRLSGRDAAQVAPRNRDVAMVFQEAAPFPHLNVRENIAFSLKARGASRDETRERVGEAAALLGLEGLLDRRPDELSGGERRRVTLARAIARRPGLLLLDEPFNGLDAPLRTAARGDVAALHRRFGLTTIFVTHDQAEALALGDLMAVVFDGRLAQCGAPRDVYDRPCTPEVGRFLGDPPMNVLEEARVEPGGTRRIGIRPEAIRLGPVDGDERRRLECPLLHAEWTGRDTVAQFRGPDGRLAVRVPGCFREEPGSVHLLSWSRADERTWPGASGLDTPAAGG